MLSSKIKINEKYTISHTNGADFRAFRYDEPWRYLAGDGLILAMAQRIEQLEDALKELALCDGSANNVANAEILAHRVRKLASDALTTY